MNSPVMHRIPYSMKVAIDRGQFLQGKDPIIATIRQSYPGVYDLSNAPTVDDPMKILENGAKAIETFNSWLNTELGVKAKNGRDSVCVYPVLDKLESPSHEFGDCLIVSVPKGKAGFKCRFMNSKGSDSYVHHVALSAFMTHGITYKVSDISKISQGKSGESAYSISHLCGNGACARPGHLLVESKKTNDERVHCHFVMRHCKTVQEMDVVRSVCPHTPKCFTNRYNLRRPYY